MTKTAVGSPRSDKKKKGTLFWNVRFDRWFRPRFGPARARTLASISAMRFWYASSSGVDRRSASSSGGASPAPSSGSGSGSAGGSGSAASSDASASASASGSAGSTSSGSGSGSGGGYSSGKDPSSRSRMSPALGRIGAAPVAMAPSALGGHCETFAKQSFGSRACFGKRGNSGRNVERSTEALDEAETLLGPRIPRGASSDHHDRIGHTRVRRPRRLRRTGVRPSGYVVRPTRVSLSTSPPPSDTARFFRTIGTRPHRSTSFVSNPPRLTHLTSPSSAHVSRAQPMRRSP